MSQILTLSLSDELYTILKNMSEAEGKAVESFSTNLLTDTIIAMTNDPLLQLAGTLSCDVKDVAEQHDDYIGAGLIKELGGEKNA